MAEGEEPIYDPFQSAIDRELNCPMCLSRFQTPKDLACPHVYCKECLVRLWNVKGRKKTISCPECRSSTVIPPNGIDGLKTNLRLRNMVEAKEKQETLKQKRDSVKRNQPPKVAVPECGEHEGEKLHLYCETDDFLICHVCAVVDHPHPDHVCRNVKEVVEEQRDRDAGILCKANAKLDELKSDSAEIKETEKVLTEFMAGEEAEILRSVRAIQKAAQERGQAMINTVRTMRKDHINDLQDVRAQLDEMTQKLETVCAVVRENMNSATDYEYIAKHRALYKNIATQIQQKGPKNWDNNFPRIKFISNKGGNDMVNLGYLQSSKVNNVEVELCSRLTLGCTQDMNDKIEDITALPDGSIAVVFRSRVRIYKTTGHFQNVPDEEYKMHILLEPPVGYKEKPCWVKSSESKQWAPHGVTTLDGKFAVLDETPFVKIFSIAGVFLSMFTTLKLPASSLDYRLQEGQSDKSGKSIKAVNYTCITQDVDGKTVYLGDFTHKVITNHNSSGKCLRTFYLDDAPYKLNVFGQRIAVTTISDRIDIIDKISGGVVLKVDIPLVRGSCVDIKSGCMFVTTTDEDSFKKENGTLEVYCSMTGKHMRCLIPDLQEPCGAMTLMSPDVLALIVKEGVNFYDITYHYL